MWNFWLERHSTLKHVSSSCADKRQQLRKQLYWNARALVATVSTARETTARKGAVSKGFESRSLI